MDDIISNNICSQRHTSESTSYSPQHDTKMLDTREKNDSKVQHCSGNLKDYHHGTDAEHSDQFDSKSGRFGTKSLYNSSTNNEDEMEQHCGSPSKSPSHIKKKQLTSDNYNNEVITDRKEYDPVTQSDKNEHDYATTVVSIQACPSIHTASQSLNTIDVSDQGGSVVQATVDMSHSSTGGTSNCSSSAPETSEEDQRSIQHCHSTSQNGFVTNKSEVFAVLLSILDKVCKAAAPVVQVKPTLPNVNSQSVSADIGQCQRTDCVAEIHKLSKKLSIANKSCSVTKLADDIVLEIISSECEQNKANSCEITKKLKKSHSRDELPDVNNISSDIGTDGEANTAHDSCHAINKMNGNEKLETQCAAEKISGDTVSNDCVSSKQYDVTNNEQLDKIEEARKSNCLTKESTGTTQLSTKNSVDGQSLDGKDVPTVTSIPAKARTSEKSNGTTNESKSHSHPDSSSTNLANANMTNTENKEKAEDGNPTIRKSKRKSKPLKCVEGESKKRRLFLSQRPKRKSSTPSDIAPKRMPFILISSDSETDSLDGFSPQRTKDRIQDNMKTKGDTTSVKDCQKPSNSMNSESIKTMVKDAAAPPRDSESLPTIGELGQKGKRMLRRRSLAYPRSAALIYRAKTAPNIKISTKISDLRRRASGLLEKLSSFSSTDLENDMILAACEQSLSVTETSAKEDEASPKTDNVNNKTSNKQRVKRSTTRTKRTNYTRRKSKSISKNTPPKKVDISRAPLATKRLEIRIENCKQNPATHQSLQEELTEKNDGKVAPQTGGLDNTDPKIDGLNHNPVVGKEMTRTRSSSKVSVSEVMCQELGSPSRNKNTEDENHLNMQTSELGDLDFRNIPKLHDILASVNPGLPTCCFCHLPANHLLGIGDLFGPYRPLAEEVLARQDSFNEHLKAQGSWPETDSAYAAEGSPTVTINRDSGTCYITARVEHNESEVGESDLGDLTRAINKSSHHLRSLSTIDHILQDSNCKTWRSKQKMIQVPANNLMVRIPGPKSECKVVVGKRTSFNCETGTLQNNPIIPNINSIVFLEPKIDMPHSNSEPIVTSASPAEVQSSSTSTRPRTRTRGLDSSSTSQQRATHDETMIGDDSTTVCISHNFNTGPLWTHGYCAVWADGVYAIRGQLYGLWDAARTSGKVMCALCGRSGATIVSFEDKWISRQYGSQLKAYHYPCALTERLKLNWVNLTASR